MVGAALCFSLAEACVRSIGLAAALLFPIGAHFLGFILLARVSPSKGRQRWRCSPTAPWMGRRWSEGPPTRRIAASTSFHGVAVAGCALHGVHL